MFGLLASVGCCRSKPSVTPVDDGWTTFVNQPGALNVYVSNSGNDAWPGTEAQPKATFAAGYALLRNGFADWLFLERGSVFTDTNIDWTKSGPLVGDGWMRLAAYGSLASPRPKFNTGTSNAIVFTPGFAAVQPLRRIAVTDVEVCANGRIATPASAPAGTTGFQGVAVDYAGPGLPFQSFFFENVKVSGYGFGFNFSDDVGDFTLRRSILTEIFVPSAVDLNSSGILIAAQGLLMEENVFYRINYPTMPAISGVSFFSHSAYIGSEATNVVTRGNIIIQATEGLMQRAGGVYDRNAATETAIAGLMGQSTGVTPTPGGIVCDMSDSVWLNPNGTFQIGNTNSGTVARNMVVRGPEGSSSRGIELIGVNGGNMGVHDVTFDDNVMADEFTYSPAPGNPADYSGLVFNGNTENVGAVATTFSNFCVSIGLGPGDSDTWGQALIARDKNNWSTALTSLPFLNYYRNGYLPPLN